MTNDAPEQSEVGGSDHPTGFAHLGLAEPLLGTLAGLGYETPTPIQAATIPAMLDGRHVVGLAQTGTGKTAAFALPILEQLEHRRKAPQALVLAPTRELALQVCEAFQSYAAAMDEVHVLPIYGGQGYGVQLSALARGVQVVVGTPGRIMDHLAKGTLDLSRLRFLVLDEADEMLNMGFAEDVETIVAETPADKQVALFSATMPPGIRRLAKQYLTDPVEIRVQGRTATAPNVRHRYLLVSYPQKVEALTRILEVEDFEGMIVFVRTKNETETLAEKLRARGFSAAAINGDIVQQQRERTIDQLKTGKLDILVATDVAARGLDVDRISHVVNFDIPTDTESYVHRVGRTGRAGRSGQAISFVTPRERRLLSAIERATRQALTPMEIPSVADVNATRLSRFDSAITAALENDELEFFRQVVAHYVNEYDVPELDVAAALALNLQGDEPMLLEAEPEPVRTRPGSARPDVAGRGERAPSGGHRRGGVPMATYRISVGKRHRIAPRQIVGALANEGGLAREDFGRIEIRATHSLVELPAELPPEAWKALAATRISGQRIELRLDSGADDTARPRRGGPHGKRRDFGDGRPDKGRKPRRKL
ncbi:MAG: DEAD/DEAH box helicase [Propionicimonas sp.]|uniref:DEAD/DEAH box helicase n=1 Tax=Propionicimonas sp. TaxID=1955623 RepID=UPI002B220D91|nr:DEAD/DEAH box helicase [Propionicimonas sp.]MEA4943782.1 DEAD/DEAH box helicase [Propionicimonas sp.]